MFWGFISLPGVSFLCSESPWSDVGFSLNNEGSMGGGGDWAINIYVVIGLLRFDLNRDMRGSMFDEDEGHSGACGRLFGTCYMKK